MDFWKRLRLWPWGGAPRQLVFTEYKNPFRTHAHCTPVAIGWLERAVVAFVDA